jgi:serine/threonine-protein kinase
VEDRVLGKRYRIVEEIGRGGMAVVYKAHDETLGRTVAVKVLDRKYAQEEGFVARFRQEAQAAANLSHPNIVNIYDWGKDEDDYYIVMEYVRGTDLKVLVQQKGALNPNTAAGYGVQVCSALAVAHGYGIVHRDIKPQNLVLTRDEVVKVMDFGIARAGDSTLTQTGSVLGTAQYISPEQAQGRPVGPESDIYSLGVVLYELTTGRVPFQGDSPVTTALMQVNETPVEPSRWNERISPALEAVILRAMMKNPADRYASADEMRADLQRAQAGETVTSVLPAAAAVGYDQTSVMPAVEDEPQKRSRAWVWILVVLAILAAGLLGAWAFGLFDEAQVTVPSVVGLTEEEATVELEDAGLTVGEVTGEASDSVPEGSVISQDPQAGASVESSASVDLVVSAGRETTSVPELVGLTEEEALAAIRSSGLTLETIQREYSADVEEGLVMSQQPEAGTTVELGSSVTIVVSRGTELVEVPDVVGQSSSEASAEIQGVGLAVQTSEEFSETVARGIVIRQSPQGGVSIEAGSSVSLSISKGPDVVTVPDVVGETEADATQMVTDAGLVAVVEYVDSADDGIVIEQWPIAGADARRGDTVTLTVGKTPDDGDGGADGGGE